MLKKYTFLPKIPYLAEKILFLIFANIFQFFHQILGKNNSLRKFWGRLIQKLAFYSPVTIIFKKESNKYEKMGFF